MSSFKVGRMGEDIKRELTAIFRELKDPRIAEFITIVRVDLSNDLSHCKVYISCFDGIEKARESVKGLTSASGFIKRELFHRLLLLIQPHRPIESCSDRSACKASAFGRNNCPAVFF